MGGPDVYVAHSYFTGDTDIHGYSSDAYFYSVKYDPTSVNLVGGATIIQLPGDRAGIARDETITGIWTYDEEIIQKEQAGDPGAPAAGHMATYPKDDGGQTKHYYIGDQGRVFEFQGIVEDLTITVKAAGGDFTVIQDAIDWLKNWIIKGDCKIEVDAATYVELLDFSGMLVNAGASLTLEGDTRDLAGMSFFDGCMSNREAVDNNVAGTTDGVISLVGNNGQPVITVTNAGANNPDFDADGWSSGDKILVYEYSAPNFVATEYTIDSVLNNAITLTGNMTNGGVSTAGAGDDSAGITLLPDRRLEPNVNGTVIQDTGVQGIVIDGFYVEPNATSQSGINAREGASVRLENVVVRNAYFGIYSDWLSAALRTIHCCAVWECTAGAYALALATCTSNYTYIIECLYGHWAERQAYCWCHKAVAINCTDGYRCDRQSYMYPFEATARHCTVGYRSMSNAMLEARQTGNQNFNNTADYVPPGGAPAAGYYESATDFGVLYFNA